MRRLIRSLRTGLASLAVAAGALTAAACTVQTHDDPARAGAASASETATAQAGPAAGGMSAPPATGTATGTAAGTPSDTAARASGVASAAPAAGGDTLVDPTKVKPEDRPRADMRVEVDVQARRLHVYRGDQRTATYAVGVGSAKWPTQPGEWVISQVVWNPEWIPPDQSWADEGERKAPGDPANPLGRAQLIYDPPRTVHGTNQPESVGKAVSHGSLRMRNAEIVRLAREIQEIGGAGEDDAWYQRVQANRTEKQVVNLPRVVPIRVR